MGGNPHIAAPGGGAPDEGTSPRMHTNRGQVWVCLPTPHRSTSWFDPRMEAAAHFTGHRHRVRAGAACALALLAIGLAGCAASGGGSGAGAKLGLSPAPNSLVASPQTQLSV